MRPELMLNLVPWLIVGIFVGGHLGDLFFFHPEILMADPWSIFKFWNGLFSYGGFCACVVLGIWFFKREIRKASAAHKPHRNPVTIWGYADAVVYGFPVGWFFGRLGCFLVHDHPGIQTQFFLGVYGICPSAAASVACHDLGLYEAVWSAIMCSIFVILNRKPCFQGFFAGTISTIYGISRFLLDFLRHPDIDARYFGLTPGQYGSILLFFIGVWILAKQRHTLSLRDKMPAQVESELS